ALYVAPEGRAPLEVLRNYEQELQAGGFEVLFQCAGRECGSRDGWLGRFFLYPEGQRLKNTPPGGRNPGEISEHALSSAKDQHYVAAKRVAPEGDVYVSIYVVTGAFPRHNDTFGHALVLLDVIETVPMEAKMVKVDAASMAKDIAASGHVALYGIYFDTDKTDIKPESAETLQEIAALLKQDAKLNLYVVGHTDNQGGYEYNMDLSQRRAAAVVTSLTSAHGVDTQRLKPAGVGLLVPMASNDNDEGRAKNRRVELVKQ
ncbi:MAG: OmpA family protein, partial [Vicinamibacteraceae bacterium]